jgi:hypothetical protein
MVVYAYATNFTLVLTGTRHIEKNERHDLEANECIII